MDPQGTAVRRELTAEQIGRHGRLELVFEHHRGRTVLAHSYQEVPFKVTRLYQPERSGLAQLILMSPTAGLFGGDSLHLSIRVGPRARVAVLSQAATKLHPSQGRTAFQRIDLDIETGGELHYHVDPIIPFARSRLHQRIDIQVTPGARMYFWDGFMLGRIARGERLAFAELKMETTLRSEGRPILLDRFSLVPDSVASSRTWVMHDADYFGSGLLWDERLAAEHCEAAHQSLAAVPAAAVGVDQPEERLLVARVLARNGIAYREVRNRYRELVFHHLLDERNSLRL